MSLRSRIEKFEALSKGEQVNVPDHDSQKKRFRLPGKSSEADTQSTGTSFITNSRSPQKNGFQNYEADLQEVWSVRRNIHHTGGNKHVPSSNSSSAVLGTQVKSGLYSRHGTIPAQPLQPASKGPFSMGTGNHPTGVEQAAVESKRTPLQDFNSKESPWNVKKGGYSYNYQASVDNMAKRPIDSSKAADLDSPFMPAAKRRIDVRGVDVMRPTVESKGASFPLRESIDTQNEKVSYAKKMAQGYLKSVGMGEFTPKSDMYAKQQEMQSAATTQPTVALSKWKRLDDDQEFDFDI